MILIRAARKNRFEIVDLGKLKKHLGINYEWTKDEMNGETIVIARMHALEKEIVEGYEAITGKSAREANTPGYPSKRLLKHDGEPDRISDY